MTTNQPTEALDAVEQALKSIDSYSADYVDFEKLRDKENYPDYEPKYPYWLLDARKALTHIATLRQQVAGCVGVQALIQCSPPTGKPSPPHPQPTEGMARDES